jgi:hypothetical protein
VGVPPAIVGELPGVAVATPTTEAVGAAVAAPDPVHDAIESPTATASVSGTMPVRRTDGAVVMAGSAYREGLPEGTRL